MKTHLVLAMICSIGSQAQIAAAGGTRRLFVNLQVPNDLLPERFCIVGGQACKPGPGCHLTALKDVLSATPNPRSDAAKADNDTLVVNPGLELKAIRNDDLRSVLASLKHREADDCKDCRPQQRVTGHMQKGNLAGYITCTQNAHATNSERIALAYLSFDQNSASSAIENVVLLGDLVTINFLNDVATSAVMFLDSFGGDYLPGTTGLGANEHMTFRLDPRCVQSSLVFPGRTPRSQENVTFQLDGHDLSTTCRPDPLDPTSIRLPDRRSAKPPDRTPGKATKLEVRFSQPHEQSGDAYEVSWTEHLPPLPLKIQQRQIAFSWRKDCLVGKLPETRDRTWSASCPKASLSAAGAVCTVSESRDDCHYQCRAPGAMPAFDLPTRVHFDRLGSGPNGEVRNEYLWDDTLVYSGQELTSFVPPADRRIIVEFTRPEDWRSRPGNEIKAVELRSAPEATQVIPVGTQPRSWVTALVPNASCSSRFTVKVVGTRTFASREQGLEPSGNLVLASPRDYRDLVHWAFMVGGGVINPRNEFVSAEHRTEPVGMIGAGLQIYYAWPVAGAWELNVIYEPTWTAYGTVYLASQRNQRLLTVPYQRFFAESVGTIWGHERGWEAGAVAGGGFGGSIHGDTEKVGINHPFLLFGMLARVRPAFVPGWLEVDLGLRWGENHEFFGTDETGRPIADTFHGEPAVTERALWQAYAGARWRFTIR